MKERFHPLEIEILAHRYLYYVLTTPVISDYKYDMLERRARAELPEDSPVHGVGSDLKESYSNEVVVAAIKMLKD